jgi:hypothetical protein
MPQFWTFDQPELSFNTPDEQRSPQVAYQSDCTRKGSERTSDISKLDAWSGQMARAKTHLNPGILNPKP